MQYKNEQIVINTNNNVAYLPFRDKHLLLVTIYNYKTVPIINDKKNSIVFIISNLR